MANHNLAKRVSNVNHLVIINGATDDAQSNRIENFIEHYQNVQLKHISVVVMTKLELKVRFNFINFYFIKTCFLGGL